MSVECLREAAMKAATHYMYKCANTFLHGERGPASLVYPTGRGLVSVYACAASDYLVAYFRSIYERDPERFYRLSREFNHAQHGLGNGAPGWAVTRFVGHLFLSLRWGNEISVHKVPLQLRESVIALGLAQGCYLDCTFVTNGLAADHQMPQELAAELAS